MIWCWSTMSGWTHFGHQLSASVQNPMCINRWRPGDLRGPWRRLPCRSARPRGNWMGCKKRFTSSVRNCQFFRPRRRFLFSFLLRLMIGCGGTSTPGRSSSLRRKRRLKVSWPGRHTLGPAGLFEGSGLGLNFLTYV